MKRNKNDMDRCEYGACREKATDIVYSRNTKLVLFCCNEHSDIVIDEDNPEYWDFCPNCSCRFGAN